MEENNGIYEKIQKLLAHPIFQAIDAFTTPAFLYLNLYSIGVILNHYGLVDLSGIIPIISILFFPMIAGFFTYFLVKDPFLIAVGIIITYIQPSYLMALMIPIILYYLSIAYKKCKEAYFIQVLPQFVENSMKDLLFCILLALLALLLAKTSLPAIKLTFLDTTTFIIGIVFIHCYLFYQGIHPGFLKCFLYPIEILFLFENISNFYLGLPLIHLLTHGMISAMCNLSGTGITMGIALLDHSLPANSIISGLFGVNEPVLFGLPIVKNKKAFIPYVIGGSILGSIPVLLMKYGYLNYPILDAPYIGVGLEGVLVNLDIRSLFVAIIQILLSILFWLPFYLGRRKNHEV